MAIMQTVPSPLARTTQPGLATQVRFAGVSHAPAGRPCERGSNDARSTLFWVHSSRHNNPRRCSDASPRCTVAWVAWGWMLMAAKWQQWMPFDLNAFRASPAVQAMHPAARAGYIYLLAASWETPDCTINNDPLELAEKSGLGDELWAIYGLRILRKFESVDGNGKLRNSVCYEKWNQARAAYQKRAESAQRTNTVRSPRSNPTVTVENSDGHRSVTAHGPVSVNVESVSVFTEELFPEMVARGVADLLGLSLGYGPQSLNTAITEVAEAELKRGKDLRELAVEMEASYRFYLQEKPNLKIQWGPAKFFGEGHWRDPAAWPRKEKTRQERIDTWRAPDDDETA